MREVAKTLAQQLSISESQLREMLPSGQQTVFENRLGWARTYLTKAGMLTKVGRGIFCISDRGKELLNNSQSNLTKKDLEQYSEFFGSRNNAGDDINLEEAIDLNDEELTPEESIELSYQKLRQTLASDVIERLKTCNPAFFEKLVVDLLLRMGYGGSRKDFGTTCGKPGDGGIDGIIKEDRLGLDSVYIQAKRYTESTVGRPAVQAFVGALQMHKARKGVLLTTSRFSKDAHDYIKVIDCKLVLIGGEDLVQLMIDYNVGVAIDKVYEVKRLDSDFFDE